jgi:hypothetical protein
MSVLGSFYSKLDRRHYLLGRIMITSLSSRIAIAASFAFVASGASAATLNFTIPTSGFTVQQFQNVAGSDASGAITGAVPGGLLTGEAGFQTILLNADAENLNIFINNGGSAGKAYFDADSGGSPGGLGSCRALDANAQCVPSSDDNLTLAADEKIRMDFTLDGSIFTDAIFGDFTFRNDDHNLINGTVSVSHESGSSTITLTDGVGDFSVIGSSSFLLFNEDGGVGSTSNYYISEANISAVPVPAAVWLFGSALAGLGWFRRRQTA